MKTEEKTMIDLNATFEKHNDDYLKFDRVENKLHSRPDLCAFLLLDKLMPNAGRNMVFAAEHNEIFLDADCEKLAEVATEEDILTLTRCGVNYDGDIDSLAMYMRPNADVTGLALKSNN
jgi:AAA15 family ATPase/GTPase